MNTQNEATEVKGAAEDEAGNLRCRVCGGPVPATQVGLRDESGAVCRTCHYKSTMGEAHRTVEAKEEALHDAESVDRTRGEKIRRRAGWVAFALVGVVLIVIWGSVLAGPAEGNRPYAFGPVGEEAPGLDACLSGLWEIRGALDTYLYKHNGTLPVSIEAIGGVPVNCPGCGKPWSYDRGENGEYRIACPSPREHQRAAVFISHRYGPPRVSLHAVENDE